MSLRRNRWYWMPRIIGRRRRLAYMAGYQARSRARARRRLVRLTALTALIIIIIGVAVFAELVRR